MSIELTASRLGSIARSSREGFHFCDRLGLFVRATVVASDAEDSLFRMRIETFPPEWEGQLPERGTLPRPESWWKNTPLEDAIVAVLIRISKNGSKFRTYLVDGSGKPCT